jgi:hypothetical protein
MTGNKVVGTIEDLHYKEEIWKAMSKGQKDKVVELRKANCSGGAVKAATTTTAGTIPMDMLDQLQALTHAVQSLDSSRDGGRQLTDRHASSGQRGDRSRCRSSSPLHGSHQSGAHAGCRKR